MPTLKFFCLFLIFFKSFIYAQDFDNYKIAESSGAIPIDFTRFSSETYDLEKSNISNDEARFDRRSKKKFYLSTSFEIHDWLYSGNIIFNDPFSIYVGKVLDVILKDNPALRSKLRVYTIKDPSVNAFATNNGIILVNQGLISQLENESQLAFILCHEITHYLKKHVINEYVEAQKIVKNRSVYKYKSSIEKKFAINRYSKETETEADLEGLELYLKSPYSLEDLDGAFDLMKYAYLPFDDIQFEKSFFETATFKLPQRLFLDTLNEISSEDEEENEKSTHPSTKTRRDQVAFKIKGKSNKGKKTFVATKKDEFLKIRKMARYEVVNLYLEDKAPVEAIYTAYMLLKDQPNSKYLKKQIAKSLYLMSKYKNANQGNEVVDYQSTMEGNQQQIHYFFEKIDANELNALATKQLWKLSKEYPKDQELDSLKYDILKSLVEKHYSTITAFKTKKEKEELIDEGKDLNQREGKYRKLKEKMQKNTEENEDANFEYIFLDEMENPDFVKAFDFFSTAKLQQQRNNLSEKEKVKIQKKKFRAAKRIRKKGYSFGIDKLIVSNPLYIKLDERKDQKRKYLASEEAEIKFADHLKVNARLAKLDLVLLDDLDVKSYTADKFNDYCFLNNWMDQSIDHIDKEVPLLNLSEEKTNLLIKKYGTKYFCHLGVINLRENKDLNFLEMCALFIPYTMPFVIARVLKPEYETLYYYYLFDLESGKLINKKILSMDQNDSKDQINSLIYDTFYQFKRKAK